MFRVCAPLEPFGCPWPVCPACLCATKRRPSDVVPRVALICHPHRSDMGFSACFSVGPPSSRPPPGCPGDDCGATGLTTKQKSSFLRLTRTTVEAPKGSGVWRRSIETQIALLTVVGHVGRVLRDVVDGAGFSWPLSQTSMQAVLRAGLGRYVNPRLACS